MTNKDWYVHNNIGVKLQDALSNVIVGQGLPYVFDGLDSRGCCVVEVLYNGETCSFYNKNPPLNDAKTLLPEISVGEAQDTAELGEDPLFTVKPKSHRQRKKQPAEAPTQ